jgi:hypothetical protein
MKKPLDSMIFLNLYNYSHYQKKCQINAINIKRVKHGTGYETGKRRRIHQGVSKAEAPILN